MNTKTLTVRVDADVKSEADAIFAEIGIPTATAINIFLRSAVRSGGFPFDLRLNEKPNAETLAAIKDVEEKRDLVGPFHSVDELMESLMEEDDA